MDYENIHMTRLADLPEMVNIPNQMPPSNMGPMNGPGPMNGGFQPGENSNMYVPLNIHPNPYGISAPPPGGMLPPQQGHSMSPQQGHLDNGRQDHGLSQESMMPNPVATNNISPEYRLPQRDIPSSLSDFTHDEEIQVNYIPKRKLARDFVKEHEAATREQLIEHQNKMNNEKKTEGWFNTLYIPVLITILYFTFSLPIVNTMVFKQFSFLSIYREDGNFNMWGLILKSILFGVAYWCIHTGMFTFINIV